MAEHRYLCLILSLTLLLTSLPESVRAYTRPDAEPVSQETRQDLPGATDDWWATVQEDIRRSEYHVTWQERTYLANLTTLSGRSFQDTLRAGAYQAPNRAHNLRTYFTSPGIRVVPRVFEGQNPPWEWALILTGYGYTGDVQPVAAATLHVDTNRVEYRRGDPSAGSGQALTEWYVNDERGLEQGFTLHTPPLSGREGGPEGGGEIALDLALSGNLTAAPGDDGQSIEFTTTSSTRSELADRVRVLRYGELVVHDATGRQLPTSLSLFSGKEGKGGLRITLDASGALYPITIDPQVTGLSLTADWTAEGDQDAAYFGWSVGTAGDVNGDGYSDVIVGAYGYDNGQMNEGRAFVYHGSMVGLSLAADWIAESNQDNAWFGDSVDTAGDVNGDGYSDVIVGAYSYDNGEANEGRAYVYHGSATGLSATAGWTAESDQIDARFGWTVSTAGDVNGDGYSDVIVGAYGYDNGEADEGRAYVYHGAAIGLSPTANWTAESNQTGAWYGYSVGTAGDVNGDGYSDVIVGAYGYENGQSGEGRAFVYHGSVDGLSPTADWTAESDQDGALFGTSVGTAGDVNGDGYSDVIVGAYCYDNGETNEGRAFVYHGSAVGLSSAVEWSAEGDQDGAQLGGSVGTAGDVNGDGYADVIVGADWYDNGEANEGRAFVYHGAATGLSPTAEWSAEGDQDAAHFGGSVGTAGDVNGDGYSDVIVGASGYDNGQSNEGRTYVYHGAATGLSAAEEWGAESDQDNAYFGWSVGLAGDVNGDGYSDVIVGAYLYDNGQSNEGRAYVYHGAATGLSPSPAWTAEGDQAGAQFGTSVSAAGDVNGDGYSDVIVGAPYYDNGQEDEGQAYVYHGAATGLSPTAAWSATADQAEACFGDSVGTTGDVNGDGYSDVIVGAPYYDNGQEDEGQAYVYHGAATGLSLTAGWTAESDQAGAQLGDSVGTAGDVNGDGYSDVIVGAYLYDSGLTDEGRATVYHGSAIGLSIAEEWTAVGGQAEAYFGYSVGTAGDVNGDGYSDVIVGAIWYDNGQVDEGRATVYHGSTTGLSPAADWAAESDSAVAWFGTSVGTAGDVNGDGYSDVIVGAPYYQPNEGRAFVYHGAATGLSVTPDLTAEGDQDNAYFGWSVGMAGDVNGDGYSDVIVGAPYYDNGQTDEGGAFLYYGNGGDGLHLLPRQMRSDGAAPIAHLGMSDSGTAFQISLIGRMPLGREEVKLHWQVAPLDTPFGDPSVIEGASPAWIDTGTEGIDINQTVGGLAPDTPYHWRVRLLYRPGNALGQPAGRWVHIPWNGWNETDLRTTQSSRIYLPQVVRQVP